jgi:3-methyl-2-oxobutanoate hydroxymethyltransferase
VPKFVKKFGNMGVSVEDAVREYARDVRDRSFPGPDQLYQPV